MSEQDSNAGGKEFSLEYVQELRRENAQWRTKYKELEAQTSVLGELSSRGIKADPSWVKVAEGQSVSDAVDQMVAKYPHLVVTQEAVVEPPQVKATRETPTPEPINPAPPQTGPRTDTATLLKERNMAEIKKDPKARKALRDEYRELLRASSHQKDPLDY